MANDTTSSYTLDNAASQFLASGFSVIPIRDLTSKQPALKTWAPYQRERVQEDTARHWFTANGTPAAPGLAVICGAVSGGLTVIDFDLDEHGNTLYDRWCALVAAQDADLLDDLPVVRTQSGGIHVYFRAAVCEGNTKLAMREERMTMIETRGEGGYVLAPPTPGYKMLRGKVRLTPVICEEERLLLLSAAAHLHEGESKEHPAMRGEYETSWEQYNREQDPAAVLRLLQSRGWVVVRTYGSMISLRRPGKAQGTSATLFTDGPIPLLYCFSTNAAPLPAQHGLSPFAVYAYLEHAGDFKAAARTLFREQGRATQSASAAVKVVKPVQAGGDEQRAPMPTKTEVQVRSRFFEPLKWAVPGLICEGLTLLVGAPKIGKSWLVLDLAMTVARGGHIYNYANCEQGEVLYLCLEDGERRAQARLNKLAPDGCEALHFAFAWRRFDDGGLEELRDWIGAHPRVRLIIIDTLARVRAGGEGGGSVYKADYQALGPLADLAKECSVSCVVVHHTRKMDSKDQMDLVSGSNGLGGAVDSVMLLQRNRLEPAGKITIMGRDMEEQELAACFDGEQCRWVVQGDYQQVHNSGLEQEILDCLGGSVAALSPKQIAEIIGADSLPSVSNTLFRLRQQGKVVQVAYGRYSLAPDSDTTEFNHFNHFNGFNTGDPPCTSVPPPDEDAVKAVKAVKVVKVSAGEAPFSDITEEMKRVSCPSCGRTFSWGHPAYALDTVVCRHCGADFPA